jgi:hypothetical protein
MECWNVGILGVKAEITHFNCKKLPFFNLVQDKLTHYSITPSFHSSNWGEAPDSFQVKFTYIAIEKIGQRR